MKKISVIILILVFSSFITWRECSRPPGDYSDQDTIVITKIIPGDSIPYAVEIEKKVPVPIYRDTGSTQWRNVSVDTMAILQDYFAKYYYDDNLMDNSEALIRLMAHTYKNRLYYDRLIFQYTRIKTIPNTTIQPIAPAKIRVYARIGNARNSTRPGLTANLLIGMHTGSARYVGSDRCYNALKETCSLQIRCRTIKQPP